MEAKPTALWFSKLIKLAIQQPIRIPSSWATVTDLAESGLVPRKDYQLHHKDAIWEGRPQVGGLSSSAVQTAQQGRAQSAMVCFCKNLGLRYCGCVKTANRSLIPCKRNNNKFQLVNGFLFYSRQTPKLKIKYSNPPPPPPFLAPKGAQEVLNSVCAHMYIV